MIRRVAIALAIGGLAIAGYFLRQGPTVRPPATALAWVEGPLDAGALEAQFSSRGVDFLRARDASEPLRSFAALRRGQQVLALDDLDSFHRVEQHGGRVWALGESTTEGPGPSLELLVSEDDGRTFEHRASVPKPNYQAMFEGWTVDGDALTVELSLDDQVELAEPWLWPWWAPAPGERLKLFAWPTVGPGRVVLRSKNGGRSWRLER